MKDRIFYLYIIIFIAFAVLCRADASGETGMIRVHDSSNVVDIGDILDSQIGTLNESIIKKICADITGRYHERGYTAFYIKRAELSKDGSADLYFNESIVSDIIVTGVFQKKENVAASVYRIGNIFNEFALKENIDLTKKKFRLKQLNVTIKRSENGDIVLDVHGSEKINELESDVFNSPIYGILPELTYRINYAGYLAGVSLLSSFNREDRAITGGSVFFNSDSIPGNSYFTISADASDRRDSFDDENIYRHKYFTTRGGYCYIDGAASVKLFLTGTKDKLADYPSRSGGVSFSGIQMKISYDNSQYKIDYQDVTAGEADLSSGWNFIEEQPSTELKLNYMVNIPFYSGFFFSLNGYYLYTSDDERFAEFYVYDQLFPCRDNDFSVSSWKGVTGIDVVYEAMKRTLYISPVFKWGVHNADNRINNIRASGAKFIFKTGMVKIDISWLADLNRNYKDGYVMFSVTAVYL